MKRFFGKLIPQVAAALVVLAATATTSSPALASSYVTLMTPPIGSEELVIEEHHLGTFPVYDGRNELMFSWSRYWAPYWPVYPNPQHTDKAYKVAVWQNTTPLAATPTWVELHTSHHWIDDANPTRFTFNTFLDIEKLCENCPSIIVVQAETIVPVVDEAGNTTFTYVPVTGYNASGVPALMKSDPVLFHHYTNIQDTNCELPANLKWACAFF